MPSHLPKENPVPKTSTPTLPAKAKANPTKAFFVRMLTRDISTRDCILDLIDNSVDSAWDAAGAPPKTLSAGKRLAKFEIRISIDKKEFHIQDNCGGIPLNAAAEYAFTFGRDSLEGRTDYSVGVYGIGMKRAIFKLGTDITVRSSPKGEQPFEVPINVDAWLNDANPIWDFDMEPSEPLPAPGVEIAVRTLTPETAVTFSDPGFVNSLRSTIGRDYILPLMQGLRIIVNDQPIEGSTVEFMEGAEFSPMRAAYDEGEVSIEIVAGMWKQPRDENEPSRSRDERSGWYVICNGRVVVAADRTDQTVWGRGRFPAWHGQYEGFIGVVLFTSAKPELLPMTTTKNGVDTSFSIYRRAQARMEVPTRRWIDYTNARKTRKESARAHERSVTPVAITDVKARTELKVPTTIAEGAREANILFKRPVDQVRALGKAFGRSTMSYTEVGWRAFDYAYARLVTEP